MGSDSLPSTCSGSSVDSVEGEKLSEESVRTADDVSDASRRTPKREAGLSILKGRRILNFRSLAAAAHL